jgi:hypothetical protein
MGDTGGLREVRRLNFDVRIAFVCAIQGQP